MTDFITDPHEFTFVLPDSDPESDETEQKEVNCPLCANPLTVPKSREAYVFECCGAFVDSREEPQSSDTYRSRKDLYQLVTLVASHIKINRGAINAAILRHLGVEYERPVLSRLTKEQSERAIREAPQALKLIIGDINSMISDLENGVAEFL